MDETKHIEKLLKGSYDTVNVVLRGIPRKNLDSLMLMPQAWSTSVDKSEKV